MKYHDERWETSDIRTATTAEAIAFPRAAVKYSAEHTIVKCTAATDAGVGLTVDSYDDAAQGEFLTRGKLRAVSGGAIAIGDPLTMDDSTAGRIRTAIAAEKVVGTAVTATTGAGEYFIGEFDFVAATVL